MTLMQTVRPSAGRAGTVALWHRRRKTRKCQYRNRQGKRQ